MPPQHKAREVFGLSLAQQRDEVTLSTTLLDDVVCGALPATAVEDLLLGMAVLRYTQSNSVCYVRGGTTLGIGDCTRLAGAKADTWWLRHHPVVRAVVFQPDIRRQDKINWQIRFIEGDLTPDESLRLVRWAAHSPDGADLIGAAGNSPRAVLPRGHERETFLIGWLVHAVP